MSGIFYGCKTHCTGVKNQHTTPLPSVCRVHVVHQCLLGHPEVVQRRLIAGLKGALPPPEGHGLGRRLGQRRHVGGSRRHRAQFPQTFTPCCGRRQQWRGSDGEERAQNLSILILRGQRTKESWFMVLQLNIKS